MAISNQPNTGTKSEQGAPSPAHLIRRLAGDTILRDAAIRSATLMSMIRPAMEQFLAGRERAQALQDAEKFAADGIASSIEFMGEEIRDEDEIDRTVTEYINLLNDIAPQGSQRNLSLNLSHIGLTLDADLAVSNLRRILRKTERSGTEIILNMEGDRYRDSILEIYYSFAADFENLGITLQACLASSRENLKSSLRYPGRVRLVKGAYDELGDAHGELRSTGVNDAFQGLMTTLIEARHPCAIATHDRKLVDLALAMTPESGNRHAVEIEMLYGVADDEARELASQGALVRIYIPYGHDWYVYLCHRLAEHPPNLRRAFQLP